MNVGIMNVGFMNVGFMNVGIVNVGIMNVRIMNVGMWLLERSCGHRQRPKHRASQVLIQVKSAVNEMKLADKKLYLRNQLVCVIYIYHSLWYEMAQMPCTSIASKFVNTS